MEHEPLLRPVRDHDPEEGDVQRPPGPTTTQTQRPSGRRGPSPTAQAPASAASQTGASRGSSDAEQDVDAPPASRRPGCNTGSAASPRARTSPTARPGRTRRGGAGRAGSRSARAFRPHQNPATESGASTTSSRAGDLARQAPRPARTPAPPRAPAAAGRTRPPAPSSPAPAPAPSAAQDKRRRPVVAERVPDEEIDGEQVPGDEDRVDVRLEREDGTGRARHEPGRGDDRRRPAPPRAAGRARRPSAPPARGTAPGRPSPAGRPPSRSSAR